MNEYYGDEDYLELMGLSEQDLLDIQSGKMKLEEDILPELLVSTREEALERLNELRNRK